ncbi:MAG TPA: hypothetical protein VFP61_02240 [Acidimicrobiales bacterium]|nr:hypothetical protein [Acidimicrobiales bacterium]
MTRPPTPRRATRIAGAAASFVAVGLLAGACDTSPVAASVNGAEIKQTALNTELRRTTANRPYVAAFDRQLGQQGQGFTVGGDAPQTLSTTFVSDVLTSMIGALAVHQHLQATGHEPSAAQLTAARSVDEAELQSLWLGFPQAYRDTQTFDDAERAAVVTAVPSAATAIIDQVYKAYQQYFFSSVCVRTVDVAVTRDDGSLDRAASDDQAQRLVDAVNGGGAPTGGQVACYDPAGLEGLGPTLFSTVLGLAPGHAAQPQETDTGARVIEVDSRLMQPVDSPAVQRAIYVGLEQSQGAQDRDYQAVVARAHVTVDPQYGSWNQAHLAVQPPSPLGANSGGVAGGAGAGQGAPGGQAASGGAAGAPTGQP